jgi:hypothetical protein
MVILISCEGGAVAPPASPILKVTVVTEGTELKAAGSYVSVTTEPSKVAVRPGIAVTAESVVGGRAHTPVPRFEYTMTITFWMP